MDVDVTIECPECLEQIPVAVPICILPVPGKAMTVEVVGELMEAVSLQQHMLTHQTA